MAGKRDSGRHSTTSFSENVEVAETSYQMLFSLCSRRLEVLSARKNGCARGNVEVVSARKNRRARGNVEVVSARKNGCTRGNVEVVSARKNGCARGNEEVVSARKNRRARGSVSPSRARVLSCAHYFQAPAMQAKCY